MIVSFVGWPGTGKTQAMMDLVRAESSVHRFFVVDRALEWGPGNDLDGQPDQPNPRWRGNPPPINLVAYGEELLDGWSPQLGYERHEGPPLAVVEELVEGGPGVYLFRPPWSGRRVAQLAIDVGNAVYVDDEIDKAAQQSGWPTNPLRQIVHEGRHLTNAFGDVLEAHILAGMRRPQSVAPDITAMSDSAYLFRVGGDLTLRRFQADAWIGADDWERVSSQPNLSYTLWPSMEMRTIKSAFQMEARQKKPRTL